MIGFTENNENTIYMKNGYDSRCEYFQCLAEKYNVDVQVVFDCADNLGEDEEFTGLIDYLKKL